MVDLKTGHSEFETETRSSLYSGSTPSRQHQHDVARIARDNNLQSGVSLSASKQFHGTTTYQEMHNSQGFIAQDWI